MTMAAWPSGATPWPVIWRPCPHDYRIQPALRDSLVSGQPVERPGEDVAEIARHHYPHPARMNARSATARQPSPRQPGPCSACGASPPLPLATVHGFRADPGVNRRDAGHALPDHAADGQRADPVPERQTHRLAAGLDVSRRPARGRRAGLGAGLDTNLYPVAGFRAHRPRPAHANLPSTCWDCHWSTSAASAPAT